MDSNRNTRKFAEARPVLAGAQVDTATLPAPVIGGQLSPEVPPRDPWPSAKESVKKTPQRGLWDPAIVRPAISEAFRQLDPRHLWRNPVMLIVEAGAVITTVILIGNLTGDGTDPTWFVAWITAWLWFTVLFANFAEAMAEGRGQAQAETLRRTRTETMAKVLTDGATNLIQTRSSAELRPGDLVLVEAGDIIPGDWEVVEGV